MPQLSDAISRYDRLYTELVLTTIAATMQVYPKGYEFLGRVQKDQERKEPNPTPLTSDASSVQAGEARILTRQRGGAITMCSVPSKPVGGLGSR